MQKQLHPEHSQAAENYAHLLDYAFITSGHNQQAYQQNVLFHIKLDKLVKDGMNLKELITEIDALVAGRLAQFPQMQVFLPVLDFKGLDITERSGIGQTLLFSGLKKIASPALIVINIEAQALDKLLHKTAKGSSAAGVFWRKEQFILFYTGEYDQAGNQIFYSKVFGGKNWPECNLLMHKLITTHLTHEDYEPGSGIHKFSSSTVDAIRACPLFINAGGIVQNFEVIILLDGETLFEHSMNFILNTDINVVKNDFAGYQIKNSHFRLGSKVHIRDFVYAKRIFQNSFFTSRFAFLIARDFLKQHAHLTSLSLVGYGMYSQLLLTRVETILRKRMKKTLVEINHDMVSDSENPHFLKNVSLKPHVLVVAPINTTFSTTFKIQQLVLQQNPKAFLLPPVNLILVTDGDFNDKRHVAMLNAQLAKKNPSPDDAPYRMLNWLKIDTKKKEVLIKPNYPNKSKQKQNYLLAVPSALYLPEHCPLCFPEITKKIYPAKPFPKERLLLQTDKTSVTPDPLLKLSQDFIVEGLPSAEGVYLKEDALLSGHFSFKGNHFNHYLRPEAFFKDNPRALEQWAGKLREELFSARPDLLSSGVLLLSAGNRNNTYFTDFINRKIFDDAAVIIHYDIALQGTENFINFFSAHISQARYIFYVDDIIQGGDTFLYMNDLVRHSYELQERKNRKPQRKYIDGVFTLINKSTFYTRSTIIANLMGTFDGAGPRAKASLKYNSFYDFHIAQFPADHCPICETRAKYMLLAEGSTLDSLKQYFYNKAMKLSVKDISERIGTDHIGGANGWHKYNPLIFQQQSYPWDDNNAEKTKYFYRVFTSGTLPDKAFLKAHIQHQLNAVFSNNAGLMQAIEQDLDKLQDEEAKKLAVERFFAELTGYLKSQAPFDRYYEQAGADLALLYDDMLQELIIKVLTDYPFNNIKPIKEKVFYWIVILLEKLSARYDQADFSFDEFRKVKFLMRRLAGMGANYLIYYDNICGLKKLSIRYQQDVNFYKRTHARLVEELKKPDYSNTRSASMKSRRAYLEQTIRNLKYMWNSAREFGYFCISIIKETLHNNESKSLLLEKTVDQILNSGLSKENLDFHFFLRLLKYENVSVLRKGAALIYDHFLGELKAKLRFEKEGSVDFLWLQKKFNPKLANAFEDYRLASLKQYLGIKSFVSWSKLENQQYLRFLQFLYLYVLLTNEEDHASAAEDLELKTGSILHNFFGLAGDSKLTELNDRGKKRMVYEKVDNRAGAFLVLKYEDDPNSIIRPERLMVAKSTRDEGSKDRDHIVFSSLDQQSLSYVMINGVCNQDHQLYFEPLQLPEISSPSKKPWIIWELEKRGDSKSWQSLRGNVFPIAQQLQQEATFQSTGAGSQAIDADHISELLYLPGDTASLKFLRLSGISMQNGALHNDGKGVIGLYSDKQADNGSGVQALDKMKFALLLLPKITKFVNKHYDSAILNALVSVRIKMAEKEKHRHGHEQMLAELQALTSKPGKNNEAIAKVIYNLLLSGEAITDRVVQYLSWLALEKNAKLREELGADIEIRQLSVAELKKDILNCTKIIMSHNIESTGVFPKAPKPLIQSQLPPGLKIELPYKLFEVILSESVINAKRYSTGNKQLKFKLYLNEGLLLFEICNDSKWVHERVMRRMNKVNKYNTHGLGLLDMICINAFSFKPEKYCTKQENADSKEYQFKLVLPIAKI